MICSLISFSRYFDTACTNSPRVRDVLHICSRRCGLRFSFVEVLDGVKKGDHLSVKFWRGLMDFFSFQAKKTFCGIKLICKHYTSLRLKRRVGRRHQYKLCLITGMVRMGWGQSVRLPSRTQQRAVLGLAELGLTARRSADSCRKNTGPKQKESPSSL